MTKTKTTYQLLMYGAIVKYGRNGRTFYKALQEATVDDLRRAQKSLEFHRGHHCTEAKRLSAIEMRLFELTKQAALNEAVEDG